jgi:hypothetical protein
LSIVARGCYIMARLLARLVRMLSTYTHRACWYCNFQIEEQWFDVNNGLFEHDWEMLEESCSKKLAREFLRGIDSVNMFPPTELVSVKPPVSQKRTVDPTGSVVRKGEQEV